MLALLLIALNIYGARGSGGEDNTVTPTDQFASPRPLAISDKDDFQSNGVGIVSRTKLAP